MTGKEAFDLFLQGQNKYVYNAKKYFEKNSDKITKEEKRRFEYQFETSIKRMKSSNYGLKVLLKNHLEKSDAYFKKYLELIELTEETFVSKLDKELVYNDLRKFRLLYFLYKGGVLFKAPDYKLISDIYSFYLLRNGDLETVRKWFADLGFSFLTTSDVEHLIHFHLQKTSDNDLENVVVALTKMEKEEQKNYLRQINPNWKDLLKFIDYFFRNHKNQALQLEIKNSVFEITVESKPTEIREKDREICEQFNEIKILPKKDFVNFVGIFENTFRLAISRIKNDSVLMDAYNETMAYQL